MMKTEMKTTLIKRAALAVAILAGGGMAIAPYGAMALTKEAAANFSAQIRAMGKFKKNLTPDQGKIASDILISVRAQSDDKLKNFFSSGMIASAQERYPGENIDCDISAEVSGKLLERIGELGGVVKSSSRRFKSIHALLPKNAIEPLAKEDAVKAIDPVVAPLFNKSNTSEGVVAHRVNEVLSAYGISGRGVKVGVLSDSIRQLENIQAAGDLPEVTVLDGKSGLDYDQLDDDDGGEGTAMLEIVHDMAPGAALYFATAYDTPAEMAENIIALADAGCKVIVDDVAYFNETPFQDGPIAQAVNNVVSRGCIVFSSAANSGNLDSNSSGTWEGDFASFAGATSLGDIDLSDSGYDAMHDFGTDDGCNGITSLRGGIYLFWSDPAGASSNDYDLFLYDRDSGDIRYSSTRSQKGTGTAMEYVYPEQSGLAVAVLRKKGAAARFLRIDTHRGRLEVGTDGSTTGHNACESVISVAAAEVPDDDRAFEADDPVETFSSDGPRRMFYDPDGNPYTANDFLSSGGRLLKKVDITAADGVSCATPGFRSFHGTSAAAPHAAAVAALILEINPNLRRDDVLEIMKDTALSQGGGWNRTTGWGIIDAKACIDRALSLYFASPVQVVFNANGGIVEGGSTAKKTVDGGKAIGALPNPVWEFHSFNGWFTSAQGGSRITETTLAVGGATYFAHWTALDTCVISFDAGGGEVTPATIKVLKNGSAGELPVPVRPGYRFLGWYTASGSLFGGDSIVASDITVYAHWEELPFTTGGGAEWTVEEDGSWRSGDIDNNMISWAEVVVGVPCTVSFDWKTSSESGYDKLHFYVDGEETINPISGTMSDWDNVSFMLNGSGVKTLRWSYTKDSSEARGQDCGWVRNFEVNSDFDTVTITLDPAGGIVTETEIVAVKGWPAGELPVPVRLGYCFLGWYTASGALFDSDSIVVSNITIYAHWEEHPFTTGGDAQWSILEDGTWRSGDIDDSMISWAEVVVGVPCTVSFDWKTSSESGYDKLHFYVDGKETINPISGIMSDWDNVSFMLNGSGVKTLRWSYTKDSSGARGQDCGWVRNFEVNTDFDVITVTLDPTGGTLDETSLQLVADFPVGELPVPVLNGHYFIGWWTTRDDSGEEVDSSSVFHGDTVLYAHWVTSPFTASGGMSRWIYQGDDVWRSGPVVYGTNSWIESEVVAPCEVSFQWKISSSQSQYDKLEFYVVSPNGQTTDWISISGMASSWSAIAYPISGNGTYKLRWRFVKGSTYNSGDACGWLTGLRCAISVGGADSSYIDYYWMSDRWATFRRLFPDLVLPAMPNATSMATVSAQTTGKTDSSGRPITVWQEYVAGTEPGAPDSKFRALISFDNGVPVVSWTPELPAREAALRRYTVYGAKSLDSNAWRPMDNVPTAEKPDYHFFRVEVEMR